MSLNGGRVEDRRRMIVRLDTHRLQTLDQVREFLDGSEQVDLQPQPRADAYAFVAKTVRRFDYALRGRADKGLLRRFLAKAGRPVTGPDHTPVAATPNHGRDRRPPRRPAPTVSAPLHQRRHWAAGRARRAPRHAVGSGHAQALRPRVPSVRRPPLRTPGRHLQRPSVQPAAHDKTIWNDRLAIVRSSCASTRQGGRDRLRCAG